MKRGSRPRRALRRATRWSRWTRRGTVGACTSARPRGACSSCAARTWPRSRARGVLLALLFRSMRNTQHAKGSHASPRRKHSCLTPYIVNKILFDTMECQFNGGPFTGRFVPLPGATPLDSAQVVPLDRHQAIEGTHGVPLADAAPPGCAGAKCAAGSGCSRSDTFSEPAVYLRRV